MEIKKNLWKKSIYECNGPNNLLKDKNRVDISLNLMYHLIDS